MSDSMFQITGAASGIAWDEIITKTLDQARKPATIWQNKIDTLEYKRTLYQELSSNFFKLRSSITSLRRESTYKKKAAEFVVREPAGGDAANVVKATVNANAEISRWTIKVDQLATAQRHISNQFEATQALGLKGTVRIQVGIQVAFLEVEEDDTIRTINQKIGKLTGPDGDPLAVTAKLIDNRLVIEGALTGLDTEGPIAETALYMHESLYKEVDDGGTPSKKVKEYQSYLAQPAKGSSFPAQLFLVKSGDTTYYEGQDYKYDAENGIITWKAKMASDSYTPKRPADGAKIDIVVRGKVPDLVSGSGDSLYSEAGYSKIDLMPTLPGGVLYNNLPGGNNNAPPLPANAVSDPDNPLYDPDDPSFDSTLTDYYANAYTIAETGTGKKFYYGTDYTFDYVAGSDSKMYQVIKWKSTSTPPASYVLLTGLETDYTVNHRQLHLVEEDMTSANSVLAGLGITTIKDDPDSPGDQIWEFTEDQYTDAQDAILYVNGVKIIRHENEISDDNNNAIIANVKLELTGVGDVTMDITQDASEAIEAMNKFVEAYNAVIEWVNAKLEEKYNANTIDDEDDYLQSILSESRGSTVFGPLHGDQLLWSIKNQLRNMISNPIASLSNTVRSRKFLHPSEPLTQQGSFYINVGGNVARIDVSKDDSLEAIRRKLNDATSINNGDNKDVKANKEMNLDVEIVDGQLIIKAITGTTNEPSSDNHMPKRAADSNYELLSFVPQSGPPVNGLLTVSQDSTTFTEGTDYRIEKVENGNGILESRIVWLEGGKSPKAGSDYNLSYDYNPTAVYYEAIPYSGDLSGLDLHYDSSNIQLSTLGVATESFNYGKSGLIEFDEEKLFNGIKDDAQLVSNVMTKFMRDMDAYIGNLVDSSSIIVGGQIVTKGRIAAALNSIDNEVSALSDQINKLEKQLAERQTAMYKQYSSMEQAIQKMNAQMSSMSQFFSQSSGNR